MTLRRVLDFSSKVIVFLAFLASAHGLRAQVLVSEAPILEAAWASGKRLTNANVQIYHGFGAATAEAAAEAAATDSTGIARTKTKQWERIEVHLPRVISANHIVCLLVDSKCQGIPVGSSIDKQKSIFYWHVPNVFKGDFDILFLQPGSAPGVVRVTTGSDVTTNLTINK